MSYIFYLLTVVFILRYTISNQYVQLWTGSVHVDAIDAIVANIYVTLIWDVSLQIENSDLCLPGSNQARQRPYRTAIFWLLHAVGCYLCVGQHQWYQESRFSSLIFCDGRKCFPVWNIEPLHWRHNERDDVSNHRRLDCLPNPLFRRRSKKTSKHRVTGLCEGNSPMTPHRGPVTRKTFPFDDVIILTMASCPCTSTETTYILQCVYMNAKIEWASWCEYLVN